MAHRCGVTTKSGKPCQCIVPVEGGRCGWHTPISGENSQCPICMEEIHTRNAKTLDCNHTFHKKCLNKWKMEGNRSCPMCREPFDLPQFRARVMIEPINGSETTHRSRSFSNPRVLQHMLEREQIVSNDPNINTELTIESEDIAGLRRVLEQIGIMLTDNDYESLTGVIEDVG